MEHNKQTDCQAHHAKFSDYPDVMNVKQLSQLLGGVSVKTCYHLLHSGQITAIKIGREYRIPKSKILELLTSI